MLDLKPLHSCNFQCILCFLAIEDINSTFIIYSFEPRHCSTLSIGEAEWMCSYLISKKSQAMKWKENRFSLIFRLCQICPRTAMMLQFYLNTTYYFYGTTKRIQTNNQFFLELFLFFLAYHLISCIYSLVQTPNEMDSRVNLSNFTN